LSLERVVFGVVLALAAYLASYRAYVSSTLHPLGWGNQQVIYEASHWLLVAALVYWLMLRQGTLQRYLAEWLDKKYLLGFVLLCVASTLWSVAPSVTAFHVLVLLAATWTAGYIGLRCTCEEIIAYLSWLTAAVVIGSFYLALFDPLETGLQAFYGPGVWRGIFWNRNHLGSMAALLAVLLLVRLLDARSFRGWPSRAFFFMIYVGAIVAVVKTKSSTGALVLLISHAACVVLLAWLKVEKRMRGIHYLVAAAAAVAVAAALLVNLDQVFAAFNKDFRLSGRVNLWGYLFRDVIAERPGLGYGMGALWSDADFRAAGRKYIGSNPVIGDNGFVDVLMGVGAIGLATLLPVVAAAGIGAVSYLVRNRTTASIFPVLAMLCILLSNLTFSLLLEIEVLAWSLVVVVLFLTGRRPRSISAPSEEDDRHGLDQDREVVPKRPVADVPDVQ
jgi:O-antigen ligase